MYISYVHISDSDSEQLEIQCTTKMRPSRLGQNIPKAKNGSNAEAPPAC